MATPQVLLSPMTPVRSSPYERKQTYFDYAPPPPPARRHFLFDEQDAPGGYCAGNETTEVDLHQLSFPVLHFDSEDNEDEEGSLNCVMSDDDRQRLPFRRLPTLQPRMNPNRFFMPMTTTGSVDSPDDNLHAYQFTTVNTQTHDEDLMIDDDEGIVHVIDEKQKGPCCLSAFLEADKKNSRIAKIASALPSLDHSMHSVSSSKVFCPPSLDLSSHSCSRSVRYFARRSR